MKRTILLISVISVFAAVCSAQDDAAYPGYMKAINASNRPLRMAIMAKDTAAAAAEATKMAAAFDSVAAYWKAKKDDAAMQMAITARDAAKTIAASTDSDAQNAALTTMAGTCNACHMVHRGGGPGAFVIK